MMARNIHLILSDIECYQESADWLGLDALLEELFLHPIAQIPATTLLGIFERYSEECVEQRNKWIELLSVVSNQELSSQLKEELENICKMHPS
jgi:hypothetical protein